MVDWIIEKHDGTRVLKSWTAPGSLSESEIEAILQHLVCRDLTVEEVIAASRRKSDPAQNSLLDRVGSGRPISFGENPHYTARKA